MPTPHVLPLPRQLPRQRGGAEVCGHGEGTPRCAELCMLGLLQAQYSKNIAHMVHTRFPASPKQPLQYSKNIAKYSMYAFTGLVGCAAPLAAARALRCGASLKPAFWLFQLSLLSVLACIGLVSVGSAGRASAGLFGGMQGACEAHAGCLGHPQQPSACAAGPQHAPALPPPNAAAQSIYLFEKGNEMGMDWWMYLLSALVSCAGCTEAVQCTCTIAWPGLRRAAPGAPALCPPKPPASPRCPALPCAPPRR